jgi:hypothetical protein
MDVRAALIAHLQALEPGDRVWHGVQDRIAS